MKKVIVYKGFERFWHWMQAVLISFLAFTGFEIHSSYEFMGYQNAVIYHNFAALVFIGLIIFAVFWHITTGEWKQYLPSRKNLRSQVEYYLVGIFKDAPHPTKKTVLSKLNPLQKLVYAGLKLLVIPLTVFSGIGYILYRYSQQGAVQALGIDGLKTVAFLHTLGAFLLLGFLIVHLYLMTTGHTIFSNLNAMITGYEELEDDEDDIDVVKEA
jgi:thiosulfate reductase cytochrome b subunit